MSPPANVRPPGLKNVGIEQHLNEQIPPALTFRDETGKSVQLGDYFGKKPMILNLVYYQCPMLCGEVLSGLESALRVLKFDVGKEFDVLTVSFDPERNAGDGIRKESRILEALRTTRRRTGLAFPDRTSRLRSMRSPRRLDSSISTIPRPVSLLMRPQSWC